MERVFVYLPGAIILVAGRPKGCERDQEVEAFSWRQFVRKEFGNECVYFSFARKLDPVAAQRFYER